MSETIERKGTGKWRMPGWPHIGWNCNDITDNETQDFICQMCEVQHIRYIHHMTHPQIPGELLCGCICAGYMENDYTGAKKRETNFKNKLKRDQTEFKRVKKQYELEEQQREDRELARKNIQSYMVESVFDKWPISQNGNPYYHYDDFVMILFKKDGAWKCMIKNEVTGIKRFSTRTYETMAHAKIAAIKEVERLK
jgi:hypothetical protein